MIHFSHTWWFTNDMSTTHCGTNIVRIRVGLFNDILRFDYALHLILLLNLILCLTAQFEIMDLHVFCFYVGILLLFFLMKRCVFSILQKKNAPLFTGGNPKKCVFFLILPKSILKIYVGRNWYLFLEQLLFENQEKNALFWISACKLGCVFFFAKLKKRTFSSKKKVIWFPRKNKIRANPITFL